MGEDCFPPKMEGGVLGDRACGGGLKGLRSSVEFLVKVERDPT